MVTEVEQEWSDDDRTQLLGLSLYEDGLCGCGLPESVASDTTNFFTFEDRICPVCAGIARYTRLQVDRDQKSTREDASAGEMRPGDGRRTFIKQMSAEEVEQRRSKRRTRT